MAGRDGVSGCDSGSGRAGASPERAAITGKGRTSMSETMTDEQKTVAEMIERWDDILNRIYERCALMFDYLPRMEGGVSREGDRAVIELIIRDAEALLDECRRWKAMGVTISPAAGVWRNESISQDYCVGHVLDQVGLETVLDSICTRYQINVEAMPLRKKGKTT